MGNIDFAGETARRHGGQLVIDAGAAFNHQRHIGRGGKIGLGKGDVAGKDDAHLPRVAGFHLDDVLQRLRGVPLHAQQLGHVFQPQAVDADAGGGHHVAVAVADLAERAQAVENQGVVGVALAVEIEKVTVGLQADGDADALFAVAAGSAPGFLMAGNADGFQLGAVVLCVQIAHGALHSSLKRLPKPCQCGFRLPWASSK